MPEPSDEDCVIFGDIEAFFADLASAAYAAEYEQRIVANRKRLFESGRENFVVWSPYDVSVEYNAGLWPGYYDASDD